MNEDYDDMILKFIKEMDIKYITCNQCKTNINLNKLEVLDATITLTNDLKPLSPLDKIFFNIPLWENIFVDYGNTKNINLKLKCPYCNSVDIYNYIKKIRLTPKIINLKKEI